MKIRVWDLPLRLFHWSLLLLVITSFVTAEVGGNWVQYHYLSGYAILTLLLFRLVWGIVGGYHARFWNFLRGPKTILAYLRHPNQETVGHNPLGALSVIGLLGVLLLQVGTGLFANDDIADEGPLAKFISKDLSDLLTEVHEFNEKIIYLLVGLHIAAILFYRIYKKKNLVKPMLVGDQEVSDQNKFIASKDHFISRLFALLLLIGCATLVYLLINLKPTGL